LLPTYFYSGTLRTFQHICNSYCQHYSCGQNVHRTRDIITPPYHCAFRSNTLSHTILVQLAYIPCPSFHTAKSAWLAQFAAHVQTESHPYHHLMGQEPLMLVCLQALAVYTPYSHGSVSVPLLPLPKTCNKCYPDAATPRCVLMGSWS
jgi:hypothetical protein